MTTNILYCLYQKRALFFFFLSSFRSFRFTDCEGNTKEMESILQKEQNKKKKERKRNSRSIAPKICYVVNECCGNFKKDIQPMKTGYALFAKTERKERRKKNLIIQ